MNPQLRFGKKGLTALCLGLCFWVGACKTKDDLRREQELQQLKQQLTQERAQLDAGEQEVKMELTRLSGLVEELYQRNRTLENEVGKLGGRLYELEAAGAKARAQAAAKPKIRPSYLRAKLLFDERNYDGAIEMLKDVLAAGSTSAGDKNNAQYLLAESFYANRDYARAALEFSQFKKKYPKDKKVFRAIYRQANSFRNLKKKREARLFYQELLERYPKSSLSKQARRELKQLK